MALFGIIAIFTPNRRYSITTSLNNAFYLFYQMGSFGYFTFLAFNFIYYVPNPGWPEPIRLQWKQFNRHKIIVKSTGEFTISTNFSGVEPFIILSSFAPEPLSLRKHASNYINKLLPLIFFRCEFHQLSFFLPLSR